jgi:mannose-6-phosphate isomerase
MNNYYTEIEENIRSFGFTIELKDFARPWGGFLVINERQGQEFSNKFFKA